MTHNQEIIERIKDYIIVKVAAESEKNKDSKICEITLNYIDDKELGFVNKRERLYGFLCDMKQDGYIEDIKSTDPDYFWVIEGFAFYYREDKKYDAQKKDYYFEKSGFRYYEKKATKYNWEDINEDSDIECLCNPIGFGSPRYHPLTIFVDKDFKNQIKKTKAPGKFGLIVKAEGRIINREGYGDVVSLNKKEASFFFFLYKNANKGQQIEDIEKECGLKKKNLSYLAYGIRSKLKVILDHQKEHTEDILPKHKHGFYVLTP